MRLSLTAACLAAALLLSTGCVDLTQKVTLNPDGSGKAVIDMKIMSPLGLLPPQIAQNFDVTAQVKKEVSRIVLRSPAIDAWKDVSYNVEADGRVHVTGTAYFKNIEKLAIGGSREGLKISWAKDPAGGMTLTVDLPTPPEGRAPAQPLTDEQIDQKITELRARWDQSKQIAVTAMEAFKLDGTYVLPGTVDQSSILKPAQGGVRLVVDGAEFPDAIEKWLDNEPKLKAALKSGKNPMTAGLDKDTITQMIFGQKGAISAHVAGDLKPQFDYAAEVAAAKAAQPDMVKKLGLTLDEPKPVQPPADESGQQ